MVPFVEAVRPWHDLFMLIGTASATLVGLLFVAVSVGSGTDRPKNDVGLRTFISPSVVHFSCVLAACVTAVAPCRSWLPAGLLIVADGLFGVVYSGLVWRNMVRHGLNAAIDLEDRMWYAIVPAVGHAAVAVAGLTLLLQSDTGCGLLALATGLLLLAGIRNAWDITTWTVLRRSQ